MQDFKYDSEECDWRGGSEEACSRPPWHQTTAPTEDWLDSAALIETPLVHAAHCYSLILPTFTLWLCKDNSHLFILMTELN